MLFFVWVTKRRVKSDEFGKNLVKMKFDSVTKRLIIVSIAFTVASLPSSILSLFYNFLSKTTYGFSLLLVTNILMFAYHGLNFLTFLYIYKETLNQIGFKNF